MMHDREKKSMLDKKHVQQRIVKIKAPNSQLRLSIDSEQNRNKQFFHPRRSQFSPTVNRWKGQGHRTHSSHCFEFFYLSSLR